MRNSFFRLGATLWLSTIGLGAVPDGWDVLRKTSAPHEVSVISANTLSFDGVRCRLLGVKDATSEEKRTGAIAMLTAYLKWSQGYLDVYNLSNPLSDVDGTPLVWLIGYSDEGPMSVDLVRAGLLEPDLERFRQYVFTMTGKAGDYTADWRGELEHAEGDFRQGKPLDEIFRKKLFIDRVSPSTGASMDCGKGKVGGEQARVNLEFVSTSQGAPPDAIKIFVRLQNGDQFNAELDDSTYTDPTGKITKGLNIIEKNSTAYRFYGYDSRVYLLVVPRPFTTDGHVLTAGIHNVVFHYSLNGLKCQAIATVDINEKQQ